VPGGTRPIPFAAARGNITDGSLAVVAALAQGDERPMRLDPSPAVRECPDCGLVQRVPTPRPGYLAACERCGAVLWRRRREPVERALATAVTGLVCFLLLVSTPLIGVVVGDRVRQTMVEGLPQGFEQQGMTLLGLLVLATLIAVPLVHVALGVLVLGAVRHRAARPVLVAQLARLRTILAPWSMPEVFLLGLFVAYTRLSAIAPVQLGAASFALAGLVLAKVATEALLDEHAVWERIGPAASFIPPKPSGRRPISCTSCGLLADAPEGSPCPRCSATLRRRRPASEARAWAYLVAAVALYGPANFLPIMTITRYARALDYTILGGVKELLDAGQFPLALLVFAASICVPVLKIASLVYLLLGIRFRTRGHLHGRTRLYRVVDVIGRWSMIDVFMISILTALVQMGALATVIPHAGAPCFAAVVVLTMLSAQSFDPRLMWDAAAEAERSRPASRGAASSGATPAGRTA
jgi:paraquat-inducible protein A